MKIIQIIKKIYSFFSKIINKCIVMPITKLIFLINEKLSKPGKKFENWLSRTNTLLFISLVIAVTMFIVIDQKIIKFSESSAEIVKDQPVKVLYDEDNYVVEGVPEKVDITLIGNKADLYLAKQSPTQEVTVNLWGLKPGTHRVDISSDQLNHSIKYSVNPSIATVIIYEKIAETKTLTVDLLNQDSLDERYIISNVEPSANSVVIKGAKYKVDQVATVKALVDINSLPKFELNETVTISSPLKAYDESGNVVDVEISPSSVDTNIKITSPSKEVPIQVIPKGKVVYNMGISSLTINNSSKTNVRLYGSEEVLAGIDYLPVEIDVEGLTQTSEFKIELVKPNGIKSMSINSVTVKVELSSDIDNAEVSNVGIQAENLGNDYRVTPLDFDSISVKIKGVKSVIEGIDETDINAYVDLKGLGEGIHELDIIVEGKDSRVEYLPSVLKMRVRISKK